MQNMGPNERPLLEIHDVVQEFKVPGRGRRRTLQAVSRVSFEVNKGESLGIVGETGSGKTTLARAVLQIPRPTSGSVLLLGIDLTRISGRRLREQRRAMQMVFQNPYGSVNPKWKVADIVEEPLIGFGLGDSSARRRRVEMVLAQVGLPLRVFGARRPRELSGGQCQRVAIARALVSRPKLIICDEAVASLDALTRMQILDLFRWLRREFQLSYLFISHDLEIVKLVSDRVAVMYLGQLCEIAFTKSLFGQPQHPYTIELIASIDSAGSERRRLNEPISELTPAATDLSGCRFRSRCPRAQERCVLERPILRKVREGHFVACHYPTLSDNTRVPI